MDAGFLGSVEGEVGDGGVEVAERSRWLETEAGLRHRDGLVELAVVEVVDDGEVTERSRVVRIGLGGEFKDFSLLGNIAGGGVVVPVDVEPFTFADSIPQSERLFGDFHLTNLFADIAVDGSKARPGHSEIRIQLCGALK